MQKHVVSGQGSMCIRHCWIEFSRGRKSGIPSQPPNRRPPGGKGHRDVGTESTPVERRPVGIAAVASRRGRALVASGYSYAEKLRQFKSENSTA